MLNRKLHVEAVDRDRLALSNAEHAVNGLLLGKRRILRLKHNDMISTNKVQSNAPTLDSNKHNVVAAVAELLEALLALLHAHLAVEHGNLAVARRLELLAEEEERRHPRAKHHQLLALGNVAHNLADLVELGVDTPAARGSVGVVTHAAQVDNVAEKLLATLASDGLGNHLSLKLLVLRQLRASKFTVEFLNVVGRHGQDVLVADVDVALVDQRVAAAADKGLEAKEVVGRVPNRRAREAPLGLGTKVVDDPEAD